MKLTTTQVADKIGVTQGTVRKLRDSGKLTDVAKRAEGKNRHYSLFDSTQVNDYLKEFGKGSRKRNGTAPAISANGPALLSRIESRLSNLEEMVGQLLKVWS